ncbi:MAG: hypothetical protein ACP5OA_02220 [Candidatus Woesearchaeota archaeon]
MFNRTSSNSHPLRTLLGMIGIIVGIVFLLQAFNIIALSFDMTNTIYLKIFAIYALISGVILAINIRRY